MNKMDGVYIFKQFDLLFFSALAIISDIMSYVLLERLNSSFYFSFSVALCLIAMLRWGRIGIVVGLAGGVPGIFFAEMNVWSGLLFYVVANVGLVIPMVLYGERNRDAIAGNGARLMLYIAASHGCLSLVKGIVIFLLTGEVTGAVDYFGATFLILVINMILCLVLRTRDGLICDMRSYFVPDRGEAEFLYGREGRGRE